MLLFSPRWLFLWPGLLSMLVGSAFFIPLSIGTLKVGKIAFDTYLDVLKSRGMIRSRAAFVFGHDREFETAAGGPILISSYHPSQQNTSTGKLTEKMLIDVFRRAARRAAPPRSSP